MIRRWKGRVLSFCMAGALAFILSASFSGAAEAAEDPSEEESAQTETDGAGGDPVLIRLWTYPVGGFGDKEKLSLLIDDFKEAYPQIRVSVRILDYQNGDAVIENALEDGSQPDLVFEGPERLVADWGARGLMVPLDDLWSSEDRNQIYEKVSAACSLQGGPFYEVPVCMSAHTMAVNRDVFRQAGALSYLDEQEHTWKTDGFVSAVSAVYEDLQSRGAEDPVVGTIYCGGQGGDQGTRALVNNLYSGYFTNFQHTAYTLESRENTEALTLLTQMKGIQFNEDMAGSDAIEQFCSGEVPMTFCWNVGDHLSHQDTGFTILPMMYPSEDGLPELCAGIWGFGIFESGDQRRTDAAKTLIRFLTEDSDEYRRSVLISGYFPVRDSMGPYDMTDLYENNDLMSVYAGFTQ